MVEVEEYLLFLTEMALSENVRNDEDYMTSVKEVLMSGLTELDNLVVTTYLETHQTALADLVKLIYLNIIYKTAAEFQPIIEDTSTHYQTLANTYKKYNTQYNQTVPTLKTVALCLMKGVLPDVDFAVLGLDDKAESLAISINYSRQSRGTEEVRRIRGRELSMVATSLIDTLGFTLEDELIKQLTAASKTLDWTETRLEPAKPPRTQVPTQTQPKEAVAHKEVASDSTSNLEPEMPVFKKNTTKEEAQAYVDAWQASFKAAYMKNKNK